MFHAAMQTYVPFILLVFHSVSQSVFQYFFQFCFILRDRVFFPGAFKRSQGRVYGTCQEVPVGGRAVLEQQLFYCNYRDNGYEEGKRIYRKAEDRRTQTQICQERKICKEEELA